MPLLSPSELNQDTSLACSSDSEWSERSEVLAVIRSLVTISSNSPHRSAAYAEGTPTISNKYELSLAPRHLSVSLLPFCNQLFKIELFYFVIEMTSAPHCINLCSVAYTITQGLERTSGHILSLSRQTFWFLKYLIKGKTWKADITGTLFILLIKVFVGRVQKQNCC